MNNGAAATTRKPLIPKTFEYKDRTINGYAAIGLGAALIGMFGIWILPPLALFTLVGVGFSIAGLFITPRVHTVPGLIVGAIGLVEIAVVAFFIGFMIDHWRSFQH